MKRNGRIAALLLALLLLAGCAGNGGENTLDFKSEGTTAPAGSEESIYEKDVYNSIESLYIDPDTDLAALEAAGEEPEYSFEGNMVYTGEKLAYRTLLTNRHPIPMMQTMFMNANGHMQPFQVNGGKEELYHVFTLQPGETQDIRLTFDPIHAPYGEEGITRVYKLDQAVKNDELVELLRQNGNSFTDCYIHDLSFGGFDIYIQADSPENERTVSELRNEMGEDSPEKLAFKDDNDGQYHDWTSGVTFGEKDLSGDGELPRVQIYVKWKRGEPLYARSHNYGENNVRIFLFVDGELVPAFNGQYFADYYQTKGVIHNIPLDTSVLPQSGEHIITGCSVFLDNITDDFSITENPEGTTDFRFLYLLDVEE